MNLKYSNINTKSKENQKIYAIYRNKYLRSIPFSNIINNKCTSITD